MKTFFSFFGEGAVKFLFQNQNDRPTVHQNILKEKPGDIFSLSKSTEELLRRDNLEVRKEFPSALFWKGKELVGFNNVKEVRTYAHQKKDEITNTMDDIVVFECLYSGGAKYPITLNITKNILEYDGEEFYYPETVGSDGQYVYPKELSNSSQSPTQEKQPVKKTMEPISPEESLPKEDFSDLAKYVETLTDASLVEKYAQHSDEKVKLSAFNNPYLSAKTRESMAKEMISGNWVDRARVAENQYLGLSFLMQLLNDENVYVLSCLAQNKNITLPLFEGLLQKLEKHDPSGRDGYVREVVSSAKFFSNTTLRIFFKDAYVPYLATNVNISENITLLSGKKVKREEVEGRHGQKGFVETFEKKH